MLRVDFAPWPWPVTVRRVADTLLITVDSRRHPADQVISLAHEVGHIALRHYHAEPFRADVDGPVQREEDEWANLFAALVPDEKMGAARGHRAGADGVVLNHVLV